MVEFGAGCRGGTGQPAVAVVQTGTVISVTVALLKRRKVRQCDGRQIKDGRQTFKHKRKKRRSQRCQDEVWAGSVLARP